MAVRGQPRARPGLVGGDDLHAVAQAFDDRQADLLPPSADPLGQQDEHLRAAHGRVNFGPRGIDPDHDVVPTRGPLLDLGPAARPCR